MTPVFNCGRNKRIVSRRKVVLPEPGAESTFSTNSPRAWKNPRFRSASRSLRSRIV